MQSQFLRQKILCGLILLLVLVIELFFEDENEDEQEQKSGCAASGIIRKI
jgi:hypothetical protein